MKQFKVAVLTGGPSLERGISLNSARSVLDHLSSEEVTVVPIYFDQKKQPYLLSTKQLYSNTPADFDFLIAAQKSPLSESELVAELRNVDIVFPAMHGEYGEDGQIQELLEKHQIPFVGSGSQACQTCFDKHVANETIWKHGFHALPSTVFEIGDPERRDALEGFFRRNKIAQAIVKPASGGSSIGVYAVSSVEEALERMEFLFSSGGRRRVVVEPLARGIEFTVIILQNKFGLPVAIIPTEIEADYRDKQIFDYRKKYLPTRQVTFHCPPRFTDEVVRKIQIQAEQLFALFGMKDFARFDGWLLESGEIWFSDFNPISGMEQNSFMFQQGARVGLSHRDLLGYILRNSCLRQGLRLPPLNEAGGSKTKTVAVFFGGSTSERQVSLMSGTNVWLKLKRSLRYEPVPYLVEGDDRVWRVPYALLLNHTVEDVLDSCHSADLNEARLHRFLEVARLRLACDREFATEPYFTPRVMSLKQAVSEHSFAFLALHGGEGEDGTIQSLLEEMKIPFNGSGSAASRLCMDKYATSEVIAKHHWPDISTAPKESRMTAKLLELKNAELDDLWLELGSALQAKSLVVKPRADGCSSGVVCLRGAADLRTYVEYLRLGATRIPPGRFLGQDEPIEMPAHLPDYLLLEPFIETDRIGIVGKDIVVETRSGWLEVTVGVIEERGRLRAMSPSITVVEGNVLSVEEKFQGGTGVNLTPPPGQILKAAAASAVRANIETVANALGIQGYARIDAFVERETGKIIVIEANSLPALTPSTVLYHQALAEDPSISPLGFIEKIIDAGYRE